MHRFVRFEKLVGTDALNYLSTKTVLVLGVGGVGGYVVEGLVRSGVGRIIVIDKDIVDETNLNRQIIALESTIGEKKVEVIEKRIKDINSAVIVQKLDKFIDKDNLNEIFQYDFDYLVENNINGSFKKNVMNVKNTGFIAPKFEFSGSCDGCGETAYLKNLTQVFQERLMIANATGCSSIYGASVPSFPYKIAWANSLFEDNAEFGLGIYKGIEVSRRKVYQYVKDNLNKDKELFSKWLDNFNNADVCREVLSNIDFDKHKELKKYASYIVPNSMWIVGGDGFAYDIGYSGIDHVISRNDNINILVLDTEVYSNTGGQASKSSNKGAVAQFASHGKQSYKKDLARIAMCYPNCYVACVNIGYDKEQYLRVLKEADEHNGPSIVIAYSPCIEHGIKKGMEYSLVDSHLATECGYFPIFRYSPEKEKFYLDSKKVDFSLYDTF